ncbi:MAG: sigma-70 family RNA polymerase sigma factor [Candidatus Promineifilaceae bacterium]|nr:sigma-70 family RNA polymerase sigma factor [Candidatus Promineifilaceae bacterium]
MVEKRPAADTVTALSDSALLVRLQQGDEASFETLFYRHYDRVYGLLFRLLGNRGEAEDAAQEVFLTLYRQRFRTGREHNVSAWLYRVAMNTGYNTLRGRRRRWQRNRVLLPDATDAPVDPAERVGQVETRALVRATLSRLQPRQTQLLLLRQMGLSYAELAEACDVAPGSVGTLLSRAAAAFRQAYDQEKQGP